MAIKCATKLEIQEGKKKVGFLIMYFQYIQVDFKNTQVAIYRSVRYAKLKMLRFESCRVRLR